MSIKYVTNLATALLGGAIAVSSMALTASMGSWFAFGIAIALLSIAVVSQLESARGGLQRVFDSVVGLVGVTAIVTSLVYAGPVVVWVAFALGLSFVGLAVAGLTASEVKTWRAQHGLPELHVLRHRAADRPSADRPLAA
jgi:FtsH-binding integral membrane protein